MKITHGVHTWTRDDNQPLSVITIREQYKAPLALTGNEIAMVNGVEVDDTSIVQAHENIEFIKKAGTKG